MGKLETLMEYEGIDSIEELMEMSQDSVNIGICMNVDCRYTTNVEPDCTEGWCEECDTNSVQSATMLLMSGF